ncbi:hypothetical protein ACS0TY_031618 [Phlomoides rotata]
MSCIHITARPPASSPSAFPVQFFQLSKTSIPPSNYLGTQFPKVSFKLTSATCRYQRTPIVCLFGGKGKSGNGNEGSPWKALENVMGNFKKDKSIEDVLKQQIQKQEYYEDGGPPGKPPGGGDGGGGFGEAEDGDLSEMWDEFAQVILATLGFIFVYIYILEGEEVTVIAKDLLRFLFTRQKSIRLSRLIEECTSFLERMKVKSEFDPYWLEREIINTPTWYDHPVKYQYIIRKLSSSPPLDYDQDSDNDDVDDE